MGQLRISFFSVRLFAAFSLILAMAGCTSNGTKQATGATSSSGVSSAILPVGSSSGAFTVTKVVRSNQDPTTTIELIGSNSEIGQYCATTAACNCRLNWTNADGSFQEVDQELGYVETNMARCLYTQVATTATYFDVSLVVVAGNLTTNVFRVFTGMANPSFNPTLNSNFVPIQRYMCRDGVQTNTNFYQDTLFDPRLWNMGYAINFYSTSLGLDYGATSSTGADPLELKGWECPPIPNDTSFSASFDLKVYSVDYVNLNNPSLTGVAPASGDNTIYPPDDNLHLAAGSCSTGAEIGCEKVKLNRHDFFLARFQDGTFKMPVCMFHRVENWATSAPTLQCVVDTSKGPVSLGSAALAETGKDIVGFAAVPDASQNCPSAAAVAIPSGKKWAKLWQFRASLPVRTIQDILAVGEVGDLFCTTRKKECSSGSASSSGDSADANTAEDNTGAISVCHGSAIGFTGPKLGGLESSGYGNCNSAGFIGDNQTPDVGTYPDGYVAINDLTEAKPRCSDHGKNCCLDYNDQTAGVNRRPANYTPNGNWCTPTLKGANNAAALGGSAEDVWLYGATGSKHACIEADTDASGKLLMPFPDAFGAITQNVRALENNSRTDYIYVVTPTSVKVENMQNPSDLVGRQYTPMRYIPGSATPIVYGLEAGTQNSSDPTQRVSMYPLCILQDAQ